MPHTFVYFASLSCSAAWAAPHIARLLVPSPSKTSDKADNYESNADDQDANAIMHDKDAMLSVAEDALRETTTEDASPLESSTSCAVNSPPANRCSVRALAERIVRHPKRFVQLNRILRYYYLPWILLALTDLFYIIIYIHLHILFWYE